MKHAYLIMVHKNSYTLEKLLQLIDYLDNDIFIHVDKKCVDFDFEYYKSILKKSEIYYTSNRIDVAWGGFSQVEAEIVLIKSALNCKNNYSYFHLLSGQCLPLKSQSEIHLICDTNNKCYLNLGNITLNDCFESNKFYYRASVYHFLQKYRNKFKNNIFNIIITFIDRCLIGIQLYILHIDLIKRKGINLACGSNWFSLPYDAIEYIVENEDKIHYYFKHASFCDELFIQTIFNESDNFKNRIVDNKRFIDFERSNIYGHPYIWREKDFEELINIDCFFARKFDDAVDKNIIDKIYNYLYKKD